MRDISHYYRKWKERNVHELLKLPKSGWKLAYTTSPSTYDRSVVIQSRKSPVKTITESKESDKIKRSIEVALEEAGNCGPTSWFYRWGSKKRKLKKKRKRVEN